MAPNEEQCQQEKYYTGAPGDFAPEKEEKKPSKIKKSP